MSQHGVIQSEMDQGISIARIDIELVLGQGYSLFVSTLGALTLTFQPIISLRQISPDQVNRGIVGTDLQGPFISSCGVGVIALQEVRGCQVGVGIPSGIYGERALELR